MKKMLRSVLFALLLTIALIPVYGLTQQHTAHAAAADTPTCYGQQCNDLDPVDTHCDQSASIFATQFIYSRDSSHKVVGLAKIIHSSACNTYWMKVVSYIGVQYLNLYLTRTQGGVEEFDFYGYYAYGNMLAGPGTFYGFGDISGDIPGIFNFAG